MPPPFAVLYHIYLLQKLIGILSQILDQSVLDVYNLLELVGELEAGYDAEQTVERGTEHLQLPVEYALADTLIDDRAAYQRCRRPV